MINFDLKWAREWKGLTQEEAACLVGVDRSTFNRWENGSRPIPNKMMKRFLAAIEMDAESLSSRRQYDEDGYPVGFDREKFGDDYDAEEIALKILEGKEFERRQEVRSIHFYRMWMVKFEEMRLPSDAEVRTYIKIEDEEFFSRRSDGHPYRPKYILHESMYEPEIAIRRATVDYKEAISWVEDFEAKRQKILANEYTKPVNKRRTQERVDQVLEENRKKYAVLLPLIREFLEKRGALSDQHSANHVGAVVALKPGSCVT
jgi:transcriptional regulator with XRE-family HTH domain